MKKKFNYYKHRISYLTGNGYNFEMEDFFSSFLRHAGMPASAELSCWFKLYSIQLNSTGWKWNFWIYSNVTIWHRIDML